MNQITTRHGTVSYISHPLNAQSVLKADGEPALCEGRHRALAKLILDQLASTG
jgi:hypothetical protein